VMSNTRLAYCRFSALVLALGLVATTLPVAAQPAEPPARVVESSDGAIYVVKAPNAWPLVPFPLTSTEFLKLQPGDIHGTLPPDRTVPPQAMAIEQAADGTLYLVDNGNNQWRVIPDPITDADLAALTVGEQIHGDIPLELTGTVLQGLAQSPPTSPPRSSSAVATGGQCIESQGTSDGSSIHSACDNGVGYIFDFAGRTVSMYDPTNPGSGTTAGPLPLTEKGGIGWDWLNPDGAVCEYVSTSHVATVDCTGGAASAAQVQPGTPPENTPPDDASPPQDAGASGVPAVLSANVRTDILAAVDRANAAWTTASTSLDASSLDGNVAGQELTDDRAELDKLRSQAHTQTNVNTSFAVISVTLDSPGHATVHTRETWFAEINAAASGQLIERTPPATYQETYVVEYLQGGWIVTKNEVA
jgi:hypothetical protein